MFDEVQEVQPEEVNQEVTESVTEQQTKQVEDHQAKNFRALQESKSKAERERDEAVRYVLELEQKYKPQVQQTQPEDEDIGLRDDELAEGKHLSKFGRKIKRLEEELNQYKKQTTEQTAEMKLKSQYPDFDKVVNSDTIRSLQEQEPELYDTIKSSNDLYKQAVAAYKLIKKNGIYQEPDMYDHDKQLAQRNSNKPKPSTTLSPQQGDSPLSRANAFAQGLTPELQKQLLKEMEEARRNR